MISGSTSGVILIAGTASMAMCLFLSPRFIDTLRRREFGQNIREEGPEGHKTKAGTPTMGGIIIFAAIIVPYLALSRRDWGSLGVFIVALACALLGFADDYTKIIKRRSLGLRARSKLIVTVLISVGLWLIATRLAQHRLVGAVALRRRLDRLRAVLPGLHLPGRRRHDDRGQLHRRARRAGRRVHRDHARSPTSGSRSSGRRARADAARRLPGRLLHRVPVVQQLPRLDLHGRHRLARARRRDRRGWR